MALIVSMGRFVPDHAHEEGHVHASSDDHDHDHDHDHTQAVLTQFILLYMFDGWIPRNWWLDFLELRALSLAMMGLTRGDYDRKNVPGKKNQFTG